MFKRGDKTDPGNYRSIMFLNTVGKAFCKLLNGRKVGVLEKKVGSVRVKQDSDTTGVASTTCTHLKDLCRVG